MILPAVRAYRYSPPRGGERDDPETGRLLLSMMFAAGLPAFLVTGWLADEVPNVPLLLVIVGGFALSVVALTLAEGVVLIAAVSLVVGYSIHSLFPAVDTFMLSSLPDRHRASAYALYSASMMGIQALGSGTAGTAVTMGTSYTAVFRGLAVSVGVVVVCLGLLYRAGHLPTGGSPGEVPHGDQPMD
ncbi:MAG: MFS transporter [Halovenus sp.]